LCNSRVTPQLLIPSKILFRVDGLIDKALALVYVIINHVKGLLPSLSLDYVSKNQATRPQSPQQDMEIV
jgi:hypothetical protein